MNENNNFSINSIIEFQFNSSQVRESSFNSFLPEFKRLNTERSKISIEKKNSRCIIFEIKSSDITAFRASVNEIINFGKVITDSIKIVENSKNK
ncbi:MAG: KEOPS complex subunit Pcc1 [Candidatus Odinarchaeota archaeon]